MKKETVEEYLTRGGKIERLQYIDKSTADPVRVTSGNNNIISMEECNLYNGEANKRKKSKKQEIKVNINKLPANLVKNLEAIGVKFN